MAFEFVGRDTFAKNGGGSLRKGVNASIIKGDSGDISAIISTADMDRDGDTIKADGWVLDNYLKNPVILFAHKSHELPVARAGKVFVKDGALWQGDLDFTPREVYEFGWTVGEMLRRGYLNTFSVGFNPIEWQERSDKSGFDFLRQELLENSIVPVPANPNAIVQAKKELDERSIMAMKGWMEYAMDEWEEKDGLIIPRDNLEKAYKACTGTGCSISKPTKEKSVMSKKQQVSVIKGLTFDETWNEMELQETFWEAYRVLDDTIYSNMSALRDGDITADEMAVNMADAATAFGNAVRPAVESQGGEPETKGYHVEEKEVITYAAAHPEGTPKAPEDAEWSGPEEVAAAEVEDLMVMCAYVDPENEDIKQGYKLPHHMAGGEHQVVWRGVAAAMAALLGGRGGVDIPDADRQGVYDHLAQHYGEFDRTAPEFRMMEDGEEFDMETGQVVKSEKSNIMEIIKRMQDELNALKAAGVKPQKSTEDEEIAAYVKDVTVEVVKSLTGKLD
jgi:HK97 family phage prohead protease